MEKQKIREQFTRDEYEISFHAEKERYFEDIMTSDLENAISNCQIIEDYPDDPWGPLQSSKKHVISLTSSFLPFLRL